MLHKMWFLVDFPFFFFNQTPPVIAGCDKDRRIKKALVANLRSKMHDKDTEGETKSICSCVFYAARRSYLGSDAPQQGMSRGFKLPGRRKK